MSNQSKTQITDTAITYIGEPFCGESRTIDCGDDHWFITCVQSPDHKGPHVASISWPVDSPKEEDNDRH